MTATKIDPFQERERLQAELAQARQVKARARQELDHELRPTLAALQRERDRAYAEASRGHGGGIKDAEKALTDAQRHQELVQRKHDGADRGEREAQQELDRLYHDHLDAFAQEAEQLTTAAEQALEALREPYWRAVQAWYDAQRHWHVLRDPIVQRIRQDDKQRGIDSRDTRTIYAEATVPNCPLQAPLDVFNRAAPRPSALKR